MRGRTESTSVGCQGWGHAPPAGSSFLFTESLLWGLTGHTQRRLRCHLKGRPGAGAQGGSLAWRFVVEAHPSSQQTASSQAGGWLGTLSGLVDFCGKGQTCPLWRRFTNTGDLPPASALLFFCVCEPDIPTFRTRRLDTYSGTSPPLLKKKTTNTPNQSKPSHPPSQLGL